MIKVFISNRTQRNCGIDTYTEALIDNFKKNDKIHFEYYVDHSLSGGLKNQSNFIDKILYIPRRIYRDNISMVKSINSYHPDIFHCTECIGVPNNIQCKKILTLHDIIPLRIKATSTYQTIYRKKKMKEAIDRCDKIITVSNYSKLDIMDYFKIPEEKIVVIYEAASKAFCRHEKEEQLKVAKKYNITRPFIITIGGQEYRKNNKIVKEIYESRLSDLGKYELIMIGKYPQKGKFGNIIYPGFVSINELSTLYSMARLFVYPSKYEGFGLPILEAMQSGAPVVSSNTTSIPEVAGDAAILVDPENSNDIAEAIQTVLENDSIYNELKCKGLSQAKKFSWEKTAEETINAYKSIL